MGKEIAPLSDGVTVFHCLFLFLQDGSTALMFACENSNVEVVQLLLSDSRCNTSLKDEVSSVFITISSAVIHVVLYCMFPSISACSTFEIVC